MREHPTGDRLAHGTGAATAKMPTMVLLVAMLILVAQSEIRRSEPSEQAAAIGALRAISTAQSAYAAAHGGYATRLKTLASPCPTRGPGFISPELAGDPIIRNGYEFNLQAGPGARPGPADCNGVPTASRYYATAVPVRVAGRASRAFAVDQDGVVWYDTRGIPPKPPFKEFGTARPLR